MTDMESPYHASVRYGPEPTNITPSSIIDALVPVIEDLVNARIGQLRDEFRATVEVLDGNDAALVAEIQRLRGSQGEETAEVLTRAAEAWERFVRAEAEHLGLRVVVPKASVQVSQVGEGE